MGYQYVLIDNDNTLMDFSAAEKAALRGTLTACGLPTDEDTLAAYHRINDSLWKALERGETTQARLKVERFADFFGALGYDGDPVAMARDYEAALGRQAHLLDGSLDLIRSLHGKCRLFIVTNGLAAVQKSRFGACPLAPYFEACFISEEMGCAKPAKQFFDRVAAAIEGFDPADALVIGDSLTSDIQGGINAGLDTCWYNPAAKPAPVGMPITYTVTTHAEIRAILLT